MKIKTTWGTLLFNLEDFTSRGSLYMQILQLGKDGINQYYLSENHLIWKIK